MGFRKNREEVVASIPPEMLRPSPYAPIVAQTFTYDCTVKDENVTVTVSTEGTTPQVSSQVDTNTDTLLDTFQASAPVLEEIPDIKSESESTPKTQQSKKPRNALVENPKAKSEIVKPKQDKATKKAKEKLVTQDSE